MGHLRSAARALAGQVDGPVELVAALKWSWELLGFDRLATGLFGQLDPPTGEVVMASAGHYPPLLVDDDGRGSSRSPPSRRSASTAAPPARSGAAASVPGRCSSSTPTA